MPRLLTIGQLLRAHDREFRIASYQRHYVWGQYRDGDKDSAAYLTECLIHRYREGEKYFLQGITVSSSHLVDGQQRLTYLRLLLTILGYSEPFTIAYDNRIEAQNWLIQTQYEDIEEDLNEDSQDIYYFKHTARTIKRLLIENEVDTREFLDYVLDKVEVLYIELPDDSDEVTIYKMMNGTKSQMRAADIIKADIMRIASDTDQPNTREWELAVLRSRYASEWDSWVRWWNQQTVRSYFSIFREDGIDLLLKLCIRMPESDYSIPLTYEEFRQYIKSEPTKDYHAAKHIFHKLRRVQRRIEDAYDDPTSYNKLQAIFLLQNRKSLYTFLRFYFIDSIIDKDELERYYKLSFLGMTIDEIRNNEPIAERFDDLLASLSMSDVYHSDTKRDVFNLLLRLNIDEDTKLGRKFDFTIWNNRSLEHIYSKSKVWHTGTDGKIYDGNDNTINLKKAQILQDRTYMPRDIIVNHDGTQLSEHCIGNLVLLYGQNNAAFGNATFGQKKQMFLSPDNSAVFQSRNLLHTICVFAANTWDNRSIVNNYNQTLKRLKVYYGF